MKLIIDINDDLYKAINKIPDTDCDILYKSIKNGSPFDSCDNKNLEYVLIKTDALLSYIDSIRKENKNETGN